MKRLYFKVENGEYITADEKRFIEKNKEKKEQPDIIAAKVILNKR